MDISWGGISWVPHRHTIQHSIQLAIAVTPHAPAPRRRVHVEGFILFGYDFLHDLVIFDVCAASDSFAEAARRLHVSQSQVSRSISHLEKIFNTRLFSRSQFGLTTDGLSLTKSGELANVHIKHMLYEAQAMEQSLKRAEQSLAKRPLHVGMPPLIMRHLFGKDIAEFLSFCTKNSIVLESYGSADLLHSLEQHTLDMGVVARTNHGLTTPSVSWHHMGSHPFTLCMRKDNPFASKDRLLESDLRELLSGQTIAFSKGYLQSEVFMQVADLLGMELKPVARVEQLSDFYEFIRLGIGVGFITELAKEQASDLAFIPIDVDEVPHFNLFCFIDTARPHVLNNERIEELFHRILTAAGISSNQCGLRHVNR